LEPRRSKQRHLIAVRPLPRIDPHEPLRVLSRGPLTIQVIAGSWLADRRRAIIERTAGNTKTDSFDLFRGGGVFRYPQQGQDDVWRGPLGCIFITMLDLCVDRTGMCRSASINHSVRNTAREGNSQSQNSERYYQPAPAKDGSFRHFFNSDQRH
jgi:hypothetical protein